MEESQQAQNVPAEWRRQITGRFEPDEEVAAWFIPDLDQELNYAESVLVLTDRRLIEYVPGVGVRHGSRAGRLPTHTDVPADDGQEADAGGRSWRLEEISSLRARP